MIKTALCVIAKADFLSGKNRADNRYRLALYTSEASLNDETMAYTTAGEVIGLGYEPGGKDIKNWSTGTQGRTGYIAFDPVMWNVSTITARGALVYNDSRPGMPAVAVLDFGVDIVSRNGPFTVKMPDRLLTLT